MTARLITSLRVDHGPAHDQIHVFVLGALTGVLTVDSGKGHALAAEMLGVTVETFRAACRVHDARSFQVFASELPARVHVPAVDKVTDASLRGCGLCGTIPHRTSCPAFSSGASL